MIIASSTTTSLGQILFLQRCMRGWIQRSNNTIWAVGIEPSFRPPLPRLCCFFLAQQRRSSNEQSSAFTPSYATIQSRPCHTYHWNFRTATCRLLLPSHQVAYPLPTLHLGELIRSGHRNLVSCFPDQDSTAQ